MTNIIEIAAQAKAAGMSYGQYVARMKDDKVKASRAEPGKEIELDIENWLWTWAKIRLGRTNEEIAYSCNMTPYNIGRVHRHTPILSTLKRFCRGLNIYLICGDINSNNKCIYKGSEFYNNYLSKLSSADFRAIGISDLRYHSCHGNSISVKNIDKIGKYMNIKIIITGDD